MKNGFDFNFGIKIEEYCRMFDNIIPKNYNEIMEFKNAPTSLLNSTERRETYFESIKRIESHIHLQILKLENLEAFSVSSFVYRTVMKKKMYEDFDRWTLSFKICNTIFFIADKVLKQPSLRNFSFVINENEILTDIVNCVYTLFVNQDKFNSFHVVDKTGEEYYKRTIDISKRVGDMHSYSIKLNNLKIYLDNQKLSVSFLKNESLIPIANCFLTKNEIGHDISWENIIERFNLSTPSDDIIIIEINDYEILNKRLQNFILTFEASQCNNFLDSENELIFSYKTHRYIYISKKILDDTQRMIEDFSVWGQYENIRKYYFDLSINQKNLKLYNRLMTYKVADLLSSASYILPLEKKDGLDIPRIEIEHYTTDEELSRSIGDIDIIFYSENTKTLYLIEYKNYQMMVTKQGDLSSEISKVKRENTINKILTRQEYFEQNLSLNIRMFFSQNYEVNSVKSILLTTKPNYYFYAHPPENFYYMDWIEFAEKVNCRIF